MKRAYETRGPGHQRIRYKPNPQHYECSEGNALLVISDKRHELRVLLDSCSNIFLLEQNTGRSLKVPYEIRENQVKKNRVQWWSILHGRKILFTSDSTRNQYQWPYNDGLLRDCGPRQIWYDHSFRVVAARTSNNKYWNPWKWYLEHTKCVEHVQDEGIADMFEWDETVAFDE